MRSFRAVLGRHINMAGEILLLSGLLLLLMNNGSAKVNINSVPAGVVSESPLTLNMKPSAESTIPLKLHSAILKFTAKRPTTDCLSSRKPDKVTYTTSGSECQMSLRWTMDGFYMNEIFNLFPTDESVSLSIGEKAKIEVNGKLEDLEKELFCPFKPTKAKDFYLANFTIQKYTDWNPDCNFIIVFDKTIQLYTGEEEPEVGEKKEEVSSLPSWLIPLGILASVVALILILVIVICLYKKRLQKTNVKQELPPPNELATPATPLKTASTTSTDALPKGPQQPNEPLEVTAKDPSKAVKKSLDVKKQKVKKSLDVKKQKVKKPFVKMLDRLIGRNNEILQKMVEPTQDEADYTPAIANLAAINSNPPAAEDVKKPYESFNSYKSCFSPAEVLQVDCFSKCYVLERPTMRNYIISINFQNLGNDCVMFGIKCGGQYSLKKCQCVPSSATWTLKNSEKFTLKLHRDLHKIDGDFELIIIQCAKRQLNKEQESTLFSSLTFDLQNFQPTHELLIYVMNLSNVDPITRYEEQVDKRLDSFAEIDSNERATIMRTSPIYPCYREPKQNQNAAPAAAPAAAPDAMLDIALDGGLDVELDATPDVTPVVTPLVTPNAAPVATPNATPVATPNAMSVATPNATPVATPNVTPVATPNATPVATPNATPVATPNATPVATPDATPDATPVATPNAAPNSAPNATPNVAPNATQNAT